MTGAEPRRDADVVINVQARLGEGPRWDHRAGVLAWVDILSGHVHRTDPDTGVTATVPVGSTVGALALHGAEGYLLAAGEGFALLDGHRVRPMASPAAGKEVRMNDGAVDPVGRFVAGTIAHGHAPGGGSLYALDHDGSVRVLVESATISNGVAWSEDGRLMYYVDSATQGIDLLDYDVEAGAIAARRRWVDIPEEEGTPDGITIDADGCVWVALWGGGEVRRYAPDGSLAGRIALPVARVTACAFGGPGLDRLFVTSASEGMAPGGLDGALFVVDPGCVGRPERMAEVEIR